MMDPACLAHTWRDQPGDAHGSASTGILITDSEGNFLIVRRSGSNKFLPGAWEIPGGKVLEGESLYQGAQRELVEETGLTGPLIPRWFHRFEYGTNEGNIVQYNFVGSVDKIAPFIRLSQEHDAYKWVPLDSVASEVPLDAVLLRVLEAFRRFRNGVRLVAIEGLDGVGKTALTRKVTSILTEHGHMARILDEFPSDFADGYLERLVEERPYLDLHESAPTPVAQTLLLAASLAYKAETALHDSGEPIFLLSDRYLLSLCAYQRPALEGAGFSESEIISLFDALRQLVPEADLVFYIERNSAAARDSRLARGDDPDLESEEFLRSVGVAFEKELREPIRWRVVRVNMVEDQLPAVARSVTGELLSTLAYTP